ncbi:MAG: hypothetical protein R3E67_02035 [Pseudomonadales bacterium]
MKHGSDALTLMTVRSHDQFNTTVYGQDDRYRGVFGGRNVVFISETGICTNAGLQDGDLVDLHSCGDGSEAARVVEGFKVRVTTSQPAVSPRTSGSHTATARVITLGIHAHTGV